MDNKNEIGGFFKRKFEGFEESPSNKIWKSIEAQIETKKSFFTPIKILFMSLGISLLIGSIIYLSPLESKRDSIKIKGIHSSVSIANELKRSGFEKEIAVEYVSVASVDMRKNRSNNNYTAKGRVILNANYPSLTSNPSGITLSLKKEQNNYNVEPINKTYINKRQEAGSISNTTSKKESNELHSVLSNSKVVIDSSELIIASVSLKKDTKTDSSIIKTDSNLITKFPDTITNALTDTIEEVNTFFNKNLKSRAYFNLNIDHSYSFDNSIKFGFDIGAILEDKVLLGFSSSFTVKESYTNNNIDTGKIDLNSALLGIELGYLLFPKKKISITPYVNYRVGFLQYNISNSQNYESIYEETFQNTEIGFRTYLNLTKSIRLGATVSYAFSSKINKIPNVNNSTYSGMSIGGSLQFHMSNWINKKYKWRNNEIEQLAPPSKK